MEGWIIRFPGWRSQIWAGSISRLGCVGRRLGGAPKMARILVVVTSGNYHVRARTDSGSGVVGS